MFDTPILYLIFNRPALAEKSFQRIREVKPTHLFIAADGPRGGNLDDERKCETCRDLVLKMIDWECEVKTLFRERNLGCGLAVSEAITWFFQHVSSGIIIEDDVLPDLSFFPYCANLLERFKDSKDVMHVAGLSYFKECLPKRISYYFSNYSNIWGWATWRRAWEHYDYEAYKNEALDFPFLKRHLKSDKQARYWLKIAEVMKDEKIDTWDYSWHLSLFMNRGISVVPYVNLIENLGFGSDATHTKNIERRIKASTIMGDLIHNDRVKVNYNADRRNFKQHFSGKTTFKNRLRNAGYKMIPKKAYEFLKSIYHSFFIKLM